MLVTEHGVGPGAYGVALAADGTAWTSLVEAGQLARVGPGGRVSRVSLDAEQSRPMVLTPGPDDAIWFSRGDGHIGRVDPAGAVSALPVPTRSGSPYGLCTGPDRTIWYTLLAADRIGAVTLGGEIEEYPLTAGTMPSLIAAGPDGALWCTLDQAGAIARVTRPAASRLTRYRRRARHRSASMVAPRRCGSRRSARARSDASFQTGGSRSSRFPTARAARMRSPPPLMEGAGPRCGPPALSSGSTAMATWPKRSASSPELNPTELRLPPTDPCG